MIFNSGVLLIAVSIELFSAVLAKPETCSTVFCIATAILPLLPQMRWRLLLNSLSNRRPLNIPLKNETRPGENFARGPGFKT